MFIDLAQLDSLFLHISSKLPNINLEGSNSLTREQVDFLFGVNKENLEFSLLQYGDYSDGNQLNNEGNQLLQKTLLIKQKLMDKMESAKNILIQLNSAYEQNDDSLVNELYRDFFNDYLTWFNLNCFDAKQLEVLNLIQSKKTMPESVSDHIMANHLKNQSSEPKEIVVIGAGPTGLMAALKLYESGAKITLLEARKSPQLHTRKQAVVLDPTIMADLRHYLGSERYVKLFQRGHIYPDGRGHIVIKDLERALMSQLHKLSKQNAQNLRIITGVKADEIISPDATHKKFRVGVLESDTTYNCDYVYCAEGGRNNFSNPRYLLKAPQQAEVSQDKTPNSYITMIYDIVENNPQDPFQIDGQLTHIKKIRDEFQPSISQVYDFISALQISSNSVTGQLTNGMKNPVLAQQLYDAYLELLKSETFQIKLNEKEENLRTFETKGQFYIATKVPPAFQRFMSLLNQVASDSKSSEESKELARKLQKNVQFEWSRLLTHKFPFLRDTRVKLDYKSSQSFVVNPQGTSIAARILKHKDQELMVLAGGDLFRAPHFYSGSGISSSHAEVNAFVHYFQLKQSIPDYEKSNRAYFLGEMQHIANFVDKKMAEYCHLEKELAPPIAISIEEVGTGAIKMEKVLDQIRSHRDYLSDGLSSFSLVRTLFQGLRQEKLKILDELINKLGAQSSYHECKEALDDVLTGTKRQTLEKHRYSIWSSQKTRSAVFVETLKNTLEDAEDSERVYHESSEINL